MRSAAYLCQAITVRNVPNPRQTSRTWVSDSTEILKPETEAQLNQMINQLEATNGAEIAVVTVPETKPAATPKVFATELFNYWGIVKKGRDNGVLFLISKSDRRVEIETGYSVEDILPDAKVGNIIDTKILPRFKPSNKVTMTVALWQARKRW
ncbi:TPM domain-containing protein [Leptodesmis sp.]|uniref:TPM domain-containing protein n=1 Tax=Leptodesmis sp. TaxID=3100501 RepID=UPI0040535343